MCVLPGGITSFEAVYAGLPAINFFETESQRFLLREIVDENATFDFGVYSPETLGLISNFIEDVYYNRKKLFQTHINTKMLIDLKGTERIINKLIK